MVNKKDILTDIFPLCYDVLGPLWPMYQEVMSGLLHEVRSDLPAGVMPDSFIRRRGKELRPLLALLCAKCCGLQEDDIARVLAVASAVQLVHMSSLLQDDVIDAGTVRHSVPTVNALRGSHQAILLADHLLAVSLQLISGMHSSALTEMYIQMLLCLSRGAMCEEHYVGQPITVSTYFDMVNDKTSELFSFAASSCQLLLPMHSKELVDALRGFGMSFGTLFQMTDDYLDYGIGSHHIGKPLLQDLRSGKMTWPMIVALHSTTLERKQSPWVNKWLQYVSTHDASLECEIVRWVRSENSPCDFADVVDVALTMLEVLPDVPARDCLQALLLYVVEREE